MENSIKVGLDGKNIRCKNLKLKLIFFLNFLLGVTLLH